jgi:hypothetical protein
LYLLRREEISFWSHVASSLLRSRPTDIDTLRVSSVYYPENVFARKRRKKATSI